MDEKCTKDDGDDSGATEEQSPRIQKDEKANEAVEQRTWSCRQNAEFT